MRVPIIRHRDAGGVLGEVSPQHLGLPLRQQGPEDSKRNNERRGQRTPVARDGLQLHVEFLGLRGEGGQIRPTQALMVGLPLKLRTMSSLRYEI